MTSRKLNSSTLKTVAYYVVACVIVVNMAYAAGCSSAYYGTMESLGYHKRDILSDRVEEARDAQVDAQEQFQSALDQFLAVTNVETGEIEDRYNALSYEYERSEARAKEVSSRIDSIDDVAEALFAEWEAELEEYRSDALRRSSQMQLNRTRTRYSELIAAMERAESKMQPVLDAFHDQVLYLKHNLNAQAIAALQNERGRIEQDVTALVAEMQTAIEEANAFIESLETPSGQGG